MSPQPAEFDPRSPFLGPAAENERLLRDSIERILNAVISHRQNPTTLKPNDPSVVDTTVFDERLNAAVSALIARLQGTVEDKSPLAEQERIDGGTIECWSDRYIAHMLADGTIPAVLGRLLGDLTWQNNVYQAVSTVTTFLEHEVVATLAKILGYEPLPRSMAGLDSSKVYAGGRITSGGTVANAEALWIMREKSFAALGVYNALRDLDLLARYNEDTDEPIVAPDDVRRDFWGVYDRCLRLEDNPDYIRAFQGASQSYRYMYTDRYYRMDMPRPVYITSIEAHYSLNKNVGLLGSAIPNDGFLQAATSDERASRQRQLHELADRYDLWFVDVDGELRMDMDGLIGFLDMVARQNPSDRGEIVVAVIPTLGTTEPCVFDPLYEILQLRKRYYRKHRLWFYIHVDAAWGGMLRLVTSNLCENARRALEVINRADSCTVDPHKLGYVPYPAGALILKDRRDRAFIDVSANYLPSGSKAAEDYQIGIASVEGSKPASAALACWLSFLSMTSEDVQSPADARRPCDLYVPLLERTLKNTEHLAGKLQEIDYIKIVHPVEGNLICFQVQPGNLLVDASNLSADVNVATQVLEDHFNQPESPRQRSFAVSSTKVARTERYCIRVTLMNPYTTPALLDEFVQEIRDYCTSDAFKEVFSQRQGESKS